MSKQLPDDWISGKKRTLNVVTDLGFRNVPAGNLTISKYPPSKNSELLFCRWLPLEDMESLLPLALDMSWDNKYDAELHFKELLQKEVLDG